MSELSWGAKLGIGVGCALGSALVGVIGSKCMKEGAEGAVNAISNAFKAAASSTNKIGEAAADVAEAAKEVTGA